MAEIIKEGRQIARGIIATNSLDVTSGDLISVSSGFAIKATTSGKIEGIGKTTYVFDSDNQTVAKRKVIVVPGEGGLTVKLTADATIANADIGSYFNLNSNQTVDVATKSTVLSVVDTSDSGAATDAVITMQLRLVRVIDSTTGEFEIV